MASELNQTDHSLVATSPEAWEHAMNPIADVRVKEVVGSRFVAELELCSLPRTAMFRLRLPNSRVVVPGGSGFIGVTIVSRGQLQTRRPRLGSVWKSSSAHVINHDQYEYDFHDRSRPR